jgi:hypothetical protein
LLTAVFGTVPTDQLAEGNAPFSLAMNTMFGGSGPG